MELWDMLDRNRRPTGKTHVRGEKLIPGDYHLVVHVWIRNSMGEYLLSQRHSHLHFGELWECTGGSAIAGDTSIDAALREVHEELGISLNADKGKIIKSERRDYFQDFCDVWLFEADIKISELSFQETEVINAKWVSLEELKKLFAEGQIVPTLAYFEETLE